MSLPAPTASPAGPLPGAAAGGEVLGGMGYMRSTVSERIYREVKV